MTAAWWAQAPLWLQVGCWLLFVVWNTYLLKGYDWRALAARINGFLAFVVLLSLLWQLRAQIEPGLSLHLTGACLFYLAFSLRTAALGIELVLMVLTLSGQAAPSAFAVNVLLETALLLPIFALIRHLSLWLLPRQLFVYLFVCAFAAALIGTVSQGVVSTGLLTALGIFDLSYLFQNVTPFYLLLGFSEAWLTGILATALVVYCPGWLCSFTDDCYLRPQPIDRSGGQ